MSRVGAARRRDAHGKNRDDSRGLRAYGGIKKKLSLGSAAVVLASTLVNVFGASSPASATTTELYSWGYNASGQLGNATTTNSTVPVKVSLPSGVTATAAAAGGGHSLAVGSDGKLYAWGNNSNGQLGIGTTTNSLTPVVVSLPAGVTPVAVAAGVFHSVALGSNGVVYDWGYNAFGQLGNSTYSDSSTPVAVTLPGSVSATRISAGQYMTEALASNGNVYTWGDGAYGELGNGGSATKNYPVQVTASGVTAIAAGGYHSLMISGSYVWAFGYGAMGQIGNNQLLNKSTAVKAQLPSGVSPTAIAAGMYHSLAIGNNGKVYSWGNNANGELGNGTTTNSKVPVLVSMPSGVTPTAVAAGADHSLAIGSDGNLYGWGYNGLGELGDSNTTDSSTPVQVSLTVVAKPPTAVASGSSADQTFAIAPPTPAPTTTTLSISPSPATANRIITLTANLSRSDGGGTIEFFNGPDPVSTCTAVGIALVSGSYQAQCVTSIPTGAYALTAAYTGDTLYAPSTSTAHNLTINPPPPSAGFAFASLGNLFAPNVSIAPTSVTCVTSSDCWTVGATSVASTTTPLALHWDGTWWSQAILPSLGVSGASFSSVSCVSTSDCWAVGLSGVDNPTAGEQVLTLNWNGSTWTQVTTPNPVSGTITMAGDPAITCASTSECWVVGAWQSTTPQDFALLWNGTTWSVGSIPAAGSPFNGTVLGSATCTSGSNCWAVGTESASGSSSSQPFAVRWNGSAWSTVSTPSATVGLGSVTCTSAPACWAVGPGASSSTAGTILKWNGTVWSTVTLPGTNTGLDAVTCGSTSNCWVVGQNTSGSSIVSVAFQFDGTQWTAITLPQPQAQASPQTIACSGADCWTFVVPTAGAASPQAYGLYTDGTTAGTPVLAGGGVPLSVQGAALGADAVGGGSVLEACQCANQGAVSGDVVPINVATGDTYTSATDLTVPGAGVPLAFTRTYDAQVAQGELTAGASPGPLGYGWSYNLGASLSYNSSTQVATVTEGNGAQDTFAAYSSSTSPAWCSGPTPNFCATSPRTIATLNNSGGTWTLTDNVHSPVTYTFNSSGTLSTITDAQGDSLTGSAGTPGSGQCPSASASCTVWMSSASTLTLTLAFNSSGQLTQVADPATPTPNTATFCYYTQACASGASSSDGQATDLYTATDPGGLTTSYAYYASNSNADLQRELVTVSPPGTGSIQNSYSAAGQVTEQDLASGEVTDFSYTGAPGTSGGGSTIVTTYPQGAGGPQQFDTYTISSGKVLSDKTTHSGSSAYSMTITARDPVSLLPTDVEDPNQNISAQSLDSYDVNGSNSTTTNGNATLSFDALGNTTQSVYNAFNQVWCTVDPADYLNGTRCPSGPASAPPTPGMADPNPGMTISYYNSSSHELNATTDALGNTTTYAYTSGVSGVPDGLMYCSIDPVSYQAGVTCPTYAGSHVVGTTTHTFDIAGDTVTSTDATGGTTSNAYGVSAHPGLVSSTTDPDGTITSYTYDAGGHVISAVATFGSYSATTAYAYDSNGRKYCDVDPYEYALGVRCPSSPPSASSPPAGVTSTFYDTAGRVMQTTNPIGGTTVTAYDGAGNIYCTVKPAAYAAGTRCPSSPPTAGTMGATIDVYNALEQQIEEISPIGGITLSSYDGAGNKVQQVVESNDSSNDPYVTTDYVYDADNRLVSTTVDPGSSSLAATTLQGYDPNGNVYCSVSADAFAQGPMAYQCPQWQPSWITSPPSPLSLYSGSPNATQANNVTVTVWNANGNAVQSTDPDTNTTISAFDGDGRTYCSADATNVTSSLAAHPSGSYPYLCPATPLTSAPTGTTTGYTTTTFDGAGRTLSSTDQVGDTTSYTYDLAGNKLTMVDPRSETTTFCYYWQDATGQCAAAAPTGGGAAGDLYSQTTPVTTADPSGETTTTTYYSGGKIDVTTTPAGLSTDTYDANGDLTSTTYSGTASGYSTAPNVIYTYNADGTKATMTDGTGTTSYSYDFAGNVTQQSLTAASGTGLSNRTTSYGYFSTGDLATTSYPSYGSVSSPTVTYVYDGTGAMASETDWLGNKVTFAHDGDGNQTAQNNAVSSTYTAGTSSTSFAYDAADQNTVATSNLNCSGAIGSLAQYFEFSTGSTVNGSRNADGQVTQDSEQYGGGCTGSSYQRNYSYDAAGRVIYQGSVPQGISSNTFAYDAAGNATTISNHAPGGGFNTYTQSIDPAGEVTAQAPAGSGSSSSFAYDTIGDQTVNVSGSVTSTYGFNQAGQMTSYNPGATTTTYTYTGDGLEASTEASTASSPSQFTWDTNGSLPTVLSDGTNDYVYGPSDTPVEQVNITTSPPASNPQFMTYTESDSSWLMTNTTGGETAFWRYDAYGTLAFGTPGSPFGYAGQYQDTSSNSTGFFNMRARWYEPQTGSFSTTDPAFAETDKSYSYAYNDPVNDSDPSGQRASGGVIDCTALVSLTGVTYYDLDVPLESSVTVTGFAFCNLEPKAIFVELGVQWGFWTKHGPMSSCVANTRHPDKCLGLAGAPYFAVLPPFGQVSGIIYWAVVTAHDQTIGNFQFQDIYGKTSCAEVTRHDLLCYTMTPPDTLP